MYREREDEIAIAIDARTGETRWEHRYRAPARVGNVTQFGRGPNATPLLLDDRLITLGYSGDLRCLDLDTGEVVWSHSLLDGLGGEVLEFGYSASPIVHDGHVVVLVGGDRYGAAAFDPADGSLVWSTPPSSVSYATPLVIQLEDQSQLVYFTADEIVGAEAGVGTRLWSYPVVNQYRNNATGPLWGNDGLLWVATQLDGGTRVLRVDRIDGATRVEEVWSSDPARCQGTPGAGRVVSGGPSDSLTNPDSRRPDLDGPDTGRLDSLRPRPGVRARLRPR
jgi:outer membrane protein assembly factor BamB